MLPHKSENAAILETQICNIVTESNKKNLESSYSRCLLHNYIFEYFTEDLFRLWKQN